MRLLAILLCASCLVASLLAVPVHHQAVDDEHIVTEDSEDHPSTRVKRWGGFGGGFPGGFGGGFPGGGFGMPFGGSSGWSNGWGVESSFKAGAWNSGFNSFFG